MTRSFFDSAQWLRLRMALAWVVLIWAIACTFGQSASLVPHKEALSIQEELSEEPAQDLDVRLGDDSALVLGRSKPRLPREAIPQSIKRCAPAGTTPGNRLFIVCSSSEFKSAYKEVDIFAQVISSPGWIAHHPGDPC